MLPVEVIDWGNQDYQPLWQKMTAFTNNRHTETTDQLWLVEHPPVFTLGQAAKPVHLLNPGTIPVVQCDRGGQVTYHGPGQLVVYPLLDLPRLGIGVRELVGRLEEALIQTLAHYAILGQRQAGAPGVYVNGAKVAALGLRVRRGRSLHGLSLNVAMDLAPFSRINPCGYPDLQVTQMADLLADSIVTPASVAPVLVARLCEQLSLQALWQSDAEPLQAP